jgi:short subunit dehydrogenase-like uncharacterized protein
MDEKMTNRPTIVVLGATGYTGQLVAAELRRLGHRFVIAGRSDEKVAQLAAEIGELASPCVVDVRDPASLAAAITPGSAVINCAGPFTDLGETVVTACIEAGAHYLDTTGEQGFIRLVQTRHSEAALAAGVSVVPAMAFEYALGDCAVAVASAGMAVPLRSVDIFYAWRGAVTSRGTRRTAVRMAGRRGVVLDQGEIRRTAMASARRTVSLSSGDLAHAVLFPSGEVVTVPTHIESGTIRGWMVLGSRAARLARVVAPVLPIVATVFRPLLEAIVTRRPDPEPEDRAATWFTIRAELHGRTGVRRAVELRGRDPYALTAIIAVAGALRVLESDAPRGVVAPARLVAPRPFLLDLARHGLRLVENA